MSGSGREELLRLPPACPYCSMADGWAVIDIEVHEIEGIDRVFEQVALYAATVQPEAVGSVLLGLSRTDQLTVELLDLLVIFFDHVQLQYSSSVLAADNRLGRHLRTYAGEGLISFIQLDPWSNRNSPLPSTVLNFAPWNSALRQADGSILQIEALVQALAEVDRVRIERDENAARRVDEAFSLYQAAHDGRAEWVSFPVVQRAIGFEYLAALSNASPLMSSALRSFGSSAILGLPSDLDEAVVATPFVTETWWSSRLNVDEQLPRTAKDILKFRLEARGFVNTAVGAVEHSTGPGDYEEAVSEAMAATVRRGRLARAATSTPAAVMLGGAVATAGNVVGGTAGPVLGGVGASSTTLAMEWIGRRIRGSWTRYFISP
ncbi:MAG: hypothetical protein WBA45_16755 [Microthrixaceae bacterium]